MSSSTNKREEFDVYHLYDAFRKRIKLLLGIICAGIVFGFLITIVMQDKYQTNMLVTSTVLENHEIANLIGQLQEIISDDDITALSQALNIGQDTVSKLKKIEAVPSESDDSNLELQIWTTSPTSVPALLEGIKNYCVNSDYANHLKTTKKQSLERLVQDYSRKLENLDSMQANMNRVIEGKSRMSSSVIISDIYSNYAAIRKQLEKNRQELELLSVLTYYNDPYVSQNPDSPKLLLNLIIAFVVSVVLAIFLIVFLAMVEFFRQNAPDRTA